MWHAFLVAAGVGAVAIALAVFARQPMARRARVTGVGRALLVATAGYLAAYEAAPHIRLAVALGSAALALFLVALMPVAEAASKRWVVRRLDRRIPGMGAEIERRGGLFTGADREAGRAAARKLLIVIVPALLAVSVGLALVTMWIMAPE